MERIDIYPTHHFGSYKVRAGRPYPFGATLVPGGINFSIFSRHADYCVLVLFEKSAREPFAEIPFRGSFHRAKTGEAVWVDFRIGNVFAIIVFDLDYENIEYGFRIDGPGASVAQGSPGLHRFDPTQILMDPYAKAIGGRDTWGTMPNPDDRYLHRARIVSDDFDWESDRPLERPLEDLVIYEMHVRGFTRHPSSRVKHPGTFAAIREKIPYLRALGVNCVELMPVCEFDEFEYSRFHPTTGESLLNYWGYSPIGFFAPKAGYAASGALQDGTMVADELKNLIKVLHQTGIEVILDVVFNHTGEGDINGPVISFKGIDNKTYYMLTPDGYYLNFSGTGNTLNCNNPIVRSMVLDCLRYWVAEYHIDGFRFDLASILGRDSSGAPLLNPPLLEMLAYDPVLAECKLIAEAWDACGLYQVGTFPAYGRWAEWNGQYRDTVRRFLKGEAGQVAAMVQRVQGSPDLYTGGGRGPTASINFVTCHDGFTLADLVSYNGKHNWANGQENRDGLDQNYSWNCGWEGPSSDPSVNALRRRQIKNAVAILMVSQGVPMLMMGDEVGRTKRGNNNSYCHDNEINWLDWNLVESNADLFRFVYSCIAFRRTHAVLRAGQFLRNADYVGSGFADITWHGTHAWMPDWSDDSRTLAFMLCGKHARGGRDVDDYIYVAMNMFWESLHFELPSLPGRMKWHVFADTGAPAPQDICDPGDEPIVENQTGVVIDARSVVILVGKWTV